MKQRRFEFPDSTGLYEDSVTLTPATGQPEELAKLGPLISDFYRDVA